ncbi:hypothetical protein FBQ97_17015 [Acidobacteria bacterium ACD]|nr:hypothetical protein [Acidobacteria bacterium ACD]
MLTRPRTAFLFAALLLALPAAAQPIQKVLLPNPPSYPLEMAADKAGNLWIALNWNESVLRVAPSGQMTEFKTSGSRRTWRTGSRA